MPQVQRAGASTSIKVFLAEVSNLKDVAPQFRTLVRQHDVQAIWIVDASGVISNSVARSFLIENATKKNLPIFATGDDWVSEGASVAVQKGEAGIQLRVNRAAAEAMSLQIPEKYIERTEYLAAN
ncbi:MAG: hypothetical protein HKN04_11745 [Rhodothermaceae bacterium]|nr:hypothetical protein [Rhodothermaceae bacterium]